MREEFERADLLAAPVLRRLQSQGIALGSVVADTDRGSADLLFSDGTVIRVATSSDEVLQLRTAATLADTRLTLSVLLPDAGGRMLIFTAAHWTIYLSVNIVHA